MTTTLAASLVLLALLDSTSFGTLLIPIWLMLTPGRPPARRVLVFLGTVAAFYFVLGLALVAGARVVLAGDGDLLDGPVAARLQLVIGVGLLVGSFWIGRSGGGQGAGRVSRWRRRLTGAEGGGGTVPLVGLALAAALLEVATMLPYLGATALISGAELGPWERGAALAAYCLVMLAPAVVLLVLRVVARRRVEPVLVRVGDWMERSAGETTAWIVGIVGVLVARDAWARMPEGLALLGVSPG
ncbi:GAP family protein [Janibacter sp. GS2]|uniref:GAP family protein n=1 Tax=Janibacter sp. GS2 TaxID=3442646 RepID=UPI003EBB3C9B